MSTHLHHIHLFCSDLSATVRWWSEMLDATVEFDGDFGGARNVFLRVGAGRLHLYDQPPRDRQRSAVHHVGIRTDDLPGLVERMISRGAAFRTGIREFGAWRYIMAEAPDGVLLELFQVDAARLGGAAGRYFADESDDGAASPGASDRLPDKRRRPDGGGS